MHEQAFDVTPAMGHFELKINLVIKSSASTIDLLDETRQAGTDQILWVLRTHPSQACQIKHQEIERDSLTTDTVEFDVIARVDKAKNILNPLTNELSPCESDI